MIFEPIDIDWVEVFSHLGHLLFAYILALPVGLNREMSENGFGFRTFPLVAVVSCGFMLVAVSVLDTTDAEGRVFQGIVTGIGFLGGGAIVKKGTNIVGTTTAASIWNMGAIGIAVAFYRYEVAIALSVLNSVTLFLVSRIKKPVNELQSEDEE